VAEGVGKDGEEDRLLEEKLLAMWERIVMY
jgi:hypothetical protein